MKKEVVVVLLCAVLLGGCSGKENEETIDTDTSITIETTSDTESTKLENNTEDVDEEDRSSETMDATGLVASVGGVETEKEQGRADDSELEQVAMGESFPAGEGIVSEGELLYSVESCEVYTSLADCSLTREDMTSLENTYNDLELLKSYSEFEDIISEEGEISSFFRFLLLEVRIQNVDAVGDIKKNEFNIYGIRMEGPSAEDNYRICYFSEAENSPVEDQPHYFTLQQGEEITVKLGFLVPAENLENHQIRCRYRDTIIDLEI